MKIILASQNLHKAREFTQLLSPLGIEVITMGEAGIDIQINEDGETFEENAHIKARAVYNLVKHPVMADDSGLEVDFLGGAPGIYSARYGGETATDKERNEKVLSELMGVEKELRTARFVCAIYLILSDEEEVCVRGELEGFIGEEPIGEHGFSYDHFYGGRL